MTSGNELLAISHSANLSDGLMFPLPAFHRVEEGGAGVLLGNAHLGLVGARCIA
jgi:hypothetical protein